MGRWMGGLALVSAIVVAGGAVARPPQDDPAAVDKAVADLAKLRELVQAQKARAREALKQIQRQQAALAEAAEQLEKALRQADAAFGGQAKPSPAPEAKRSPVSSPTTGTATDHIVVHLAAQGWKLSAGSFQVDGEGHVVMAPINATLQAEKAERRFSAGRAVLRLDRPVKDVAGLGERTILSMQMTGGVKVRNDQGYLLDADKLDMTFSEGTTMTAEGKVHYQSGDLPAGALCIRGDRLLLADTLWFAGKVTVQTPELQATAERGRYDPAKNKLHLEGEPSATIRRKDGDTVEGKRILFDLTTGKFSVEGASASRE